MDLELVTWLKDGKYRIKTLKLLKIKSYLSSELAISLNINRASMSRILRVLKEKELVKPISNKSRTISYTLSDKGTRILKELKREGM